MLAPTLMLAVNAVTYFRVFVVMLLGIVLAVEVDAKFCNEFKLVFHPPLSFMQGIAQGQVKIWSKNARCSWSNQFCVHLV